MSQEPSLVPRVPAVRLGWSLAWLSAALVAAFPGYAAYGYYRFGIMGIVAALIAGATCWIGAVGALTTTSLMQQRSPVGGLFLGMVCRMGLPLLGGLILQSSVPSLARAGIFGFMLCYYFLALVVETLLAVRMIPHRPKVAKSS